MSSELHTWMRSMLFIHINSINYKNITSNFVELYAHSGQKVPCGMYMVCHKPGEVSRAGCTWLPVKLAKSPHGMPTDFNMIFSYFVFITCTFRSYHVEAPIFGYIVLDLFTPTSIIWGVASWKMEWKQHESRSYDIWNHTAWFFPH